MSMIVKASMHASIQKHIYSPSIQLTILLIMSETRKKILKTKIFLLKLYLIPLHTVILVKLNKITNSFYPILNHNILNTYCGFKNKKIAHQDMTFLTTTCEAFCT